MTAIPPEAGKPFIYARLRDGERFPAKLVLSRELRTLPDLSRANDRLGRYPLKLTFVSKSTQ